MTTIRATAPKDFIFQQNDTLPTRTQKLEILRRALAGLLVPAEEDGIPDHGHTISQIVNLQAALDELRDGQGYYRVGAFITYIVDVNETVMIHVVTEDVDIPANFTGSEGFAGTPPASPMAFIVWKNPIFDVAQIEGGEQIGTMTIATDGTFTFATTSGRSFRLYDGDTIAMQAPATGGTVSAATWTLRLLVGFAKAAVLSSGDMQIDGNDGILFSGDMQGTGLDRELVSGDMIDG